MDINRFTEKAQESLASAQRLATRLRQPQADPEHAVLTLVDQEGRYGDDRPDGERSRCDARSSHECAPRSGWPPAGDVAEPGNDLSSPGTLRPGLDPIGPSRQARSGHRPR